MIPSATFNVVPKPAIAAPLFQNRGRYQDQDFRGQNLEKVRSHHSRFDRALMQKAILTGADFWDSKFTDAQMQEVDARLANFRNCDFTGADFSGADLRGTKFIAANLRDCKFTGALIDKGTDFTWANKAGVIDFPSLED